jgi:hypothetical protein
VAVAAGAALLTSVAWYTAFAEPYADLVAASAATSTSPAVAMGVGFGRSLVVAAVLALLVHRLDVTRVRAGLGVAALARVAFPATLVVGSVVHGGVPVALAAIHAGDWLVKLVFVTTILVTARRRGRDR